MRSKLYTCVFPQKMQNLSISQSGSLHIMNRMKRDPSRIPAYSERDHASRAGIPAESSRIPVGILIYFAGIYSGSHFFLRESRYIPIKIPPYPSGIPEYFDMGFILGSRFLARNPEILFRWNQVGFRLEFQWDPSQNPSGIPDSFSLGKYI